MNNTDMTQLEQISLLATKRVQLEEEIRKAVVAARGSGISWIKIGEALGVSRQAAQKRYGGSGLLF